MHRWMGLILGIWLLLQVLTGAVLNFEDNIISDVKSGDLVKVDESPVDNMLAILERDFSEHQLLRIEYPTGGKTSFIVRTQHKSSKQQYYSKYLPSSNKLITFNFFEYATVWFFKFHEELLIEKTGRYIVGILGIALFLWVISGLYLWWPSSKIRALKICWQGSYRMKLYDLHRVTGVIVSVFLLIISVTGVAMSYRTALLEAFDSAQVISSNSIKEQNLLHCLQHKKIDITIDCFASTKGISSVKGIRFDAQREQIKVLLYASDHSRSFAVDTVVLSTAEASKSKVNLAIEENDYETVLNWMYPLHTAKVMGTFGKFIMFIVSLMTSLLIVIGWLIWWDKKRGQKHATKIRT